MEKIRSFEEAMKKIGFTLAEIMIVLTIIGVLTMILLPIANHSRPDENVMKFKKADTTFKNVIRELVNSDKYYADGDLGVRKMPDGTTRLIDGTNSGDYSYFCNSIADLLSTKKYTCSDSARDGYYLDLGAKYKDVQKFLDCMCATAQKNSSSLTQIITTPDNVSYYFLTSKYPFGLSTSNFWSSNSTNCNEVYGSANYCNGRMYSGTNNVDDNGFGRIYATFCIDIDGIPENTPYPSGCDFNITEEKSEGCGNECPFGYGIREDGKIITGYRAQQWLEKGFQKGSNEN